MLLTQLSKAAAPTHYTLLRKKLSVDEVKAVLFFLFFLLVTGIRIHT